jgi:Rhodopirellula transposase DDE domain
VGEKNFVQFTDSLVLLTNLIEQYKAGNPTDPTMYWIHLRPREIAEKYYQLHGQKISHGVVKRLLFQLNFKYRKFSKQLPTGSYAKRDLQFKVIFGLVAIMSTGSPIISIDCKKKEVIGNLYRNGKCYSQAPIKVYDHDYSYLAEGKIIPHGIYDLLRNEGYMSLGNSAETAEFIADNLLWWWENYGIHQYPTTKNILILCDAGGANDHRHHCFKKHMLALSSKIGRNIIICHYPPYASKWNPIEHRLFAFVHQAMDGAVFTSMDVVKELIEKTTTKQGLKVVVRIVHKKYQTGIKTSKNEVDQKRIKYSKIIPNLTYQIYA